MLITALRGDQALELTRKHHPDLLLVDLNLPDMSGEEVLRRVHEEPKTYNVPVVIISADASPVQAERLLAAGAQLYLTKPIDVRQFLQVLSDVLKTELQMLPPAQETTLSPEMIKHGTESYSA